VSVYEKLDAMRIRLYEILDSGHKP